MTAGFPCSCGRQLCSGNVFPSVNLLAACEVEAAGLDLQGSATSSRSAEDTGSDINSTLIHISNIQVISFFTSFLTVFSISPGFSLCSGQIVAESNPVRWCFASSFDASPSRSAANADFWTLILLEFSLIFKIFLTILKHRATLRSTAYQSRFSVLDTVSWICVAELVKISRLILTFL